MRWPMPLPPPVITAVLSFNRRSRKMLFMKLKNSRAKRVKAGVSGVLAHGRTRGSGADGGVGPTTVGCACQNWGTSTRPSPVSWFPPRALGAHAGEEVEAGHGEQHVRRPGGDGRG